MSFQKAPLNREPGLGPSAPQNAVSLIHRDSGGAAEMSQKPSKVSVLTAMQEQLQQPPSCRFHMCVFKLPNRMSTHQLRPLRRLGSYAMNLKVHESEELPQESPAATGNAPRNLCVWL